MAQPVFRPIREFGASGDLCPARAFVGKLLQQRLPLLLLLLLPGSSCCCWGFTAYHPHSVPPPLSYSSDSVVCPANSLRRWLSLLSRVPFFLSVFFLLLCPVTVTRALQRKLPNQRSPNQTQPLFFHYPFPSLFSPQHHNVKGQSVLLLLSVLVGAVERFGGGFRVSQIACREKFKN